MSRTTLTAASLLLLGGAVFAASPDGSTTPFVPSEAGWGSGPGRTAGSTGAVAATRPAGPRAAAFLRSLYRRQELIVLAADERDVILRRTKYGPPQEAHLYRMAVPPAEVRAAFLDYVGAINGLYETPRWYHGLCANCTTSFYRLPNSRCRLDWRVLANGRLDRALYEDGRLDRSLPFDELRRLARLNDIANAAPADGFGDHVRREFEGLRHDR